MAAVRSLLVLKTYRTALSNKSPIKNISSFYFSQLFVHLLKRCLKNIYKPKQNEYVHVY